VGADRAQNRLTRWFVARVARRADYLTLRDQHSAEALRSLRVDASNEQIYPDLAFALPRPADEPPRHPCVGVGLINYFDWRGRPATRATNRATYERTMIALVEWLLESGYAVRLLTGDIWDDPCLERVRGALRTRHPDLDPNRLMGTPARDLHELMKQLSGVEVVIGARYHNVIAALRLAKPILALSYAPKANQAMELFGLGPFSHRLDAIDLPRLKDQFTELYARRVEIAHDLCIKRTEIEMQLQAQAEQFLTEFLLSPAPRESSRRLRRRITQAA
jgi:polysaccharide pyruvyl transferase WcaK-like protein